MLRYAITDRKALASDEAERQAMLLARAAAWARDGIDYIQLREKDLGAEELERLAAEVVASVRSVGAPGKKLRWTRVLVNGPVEVAIAAGADGVHLTAAQGSGMTLQMREMYAGAGLREPAISLSCHTLREIEAARDAGATVALYGPVFGKSVEGMTVAAGMGLDALRVVCRAAAPMPVLALGGVTKENAAECEAAGAAGVAGIRMFQG